MSQQPLILTPQDYDAHIRLQLEHAYFARHCQRIEPKDLFEDEYKLQIEALNMEIPGEDSLAGTIPFIFHAAQQRLSDFAMMMMLELGFIRIALVKPRQVGWSTLIQSLLHWYATRIAGFKIHTINHDSDSSGKFLRRFKKLCLAAPPYIKQGRQVENRKEILFDNNSYHTISTAGSPDALRSDAIHALHLTEEDSVDDPASLTAAVLPALSDGRGSVGFRESTAKGKNRPWHIFIQEALAGQNLWRVFHDPWYNHPKYQRTPPVGWEPNEATKTAIAFIKESLKYELTPAQAYWRQMKAQELRAEWLFKQEFPATIDEAFQASANTLYNPTAVYRASTNSVTADGYAPLIMGVDPARTGDRTVLAFRQGNVFHKIIKFNKMDDMQLVGIIANFLQVGLEVGIRKIPVAKCFIDYAIGEGAASRLRELGFSRQITTVHFGEQAIEERYANKRIEMAMAFRDWLGDTGEHVQIPNDNDVIADLLAIPDFLESSGSEKLKLAPKDKIKKEYGRSPDIADAMWLTFAYPVQGERPPEMQELFEKYAPVYGKGECQEILDDFSY